MWNIFKGKSQKEKLIEKRNQLLKKAYLASHTNRKLADKLQYEISVIEEKLNSA